MKETKKGSLTYQVKKRFTAMQAFGQSKHNDKETNKKETGKSIPPRGKIYSYGTYCAYVREGVLFARWAKEEHGCRTLEDARQYTGEYLDATQEKGLSAWTIRSKAAVLGKLYGCASTDLGSSLPIRRRGDIEKNRSEDRTSGGHYSEERHTDIKEFCQASGLRRKELAALRPTDISQNTAGATVVHVRCGKGGRERWVTALNDKPLQIAQEAAARGDTRVFPHISKAAPIHVYRQDFARTLYNNTARNVSTLPRHELYIAKSDKKGKIYDRKAMYTVSSALGHSRIDVVTHYI